MDLQQLNALREKNDKIGTAMRALVAKACDGDDAPGFQNDEETEWRKMLAEFESNENTIEICQRQLDVDTGLETAVKDYNHLRGNPLDGADPQLGRGAPGEPVGRQIVERAIDKYYAAEYRLTAGGFAIEPGPQDERAYIDAFRAEMRFSGPNADQKAILQQYRAAQTSTTTGGGYTIPTGFRSDIEVSMLAFGGIRNIATIWPTPQGNPIEWPTITDSANQGRLLTENSASTDLALVFAQITFNAYKYTSDSILVPVELAQDTGIALEALIARMLGERLGRVTSSAYAIADGSSKPQGLITAINIGSQAASATVFTYNEVLDLIHSIDPAYRIGPGVGFVFADNTLKLAKQIKDESNSQRPLWAPNIASAVPATIDGFPYQIDQNVPIVADNSPNGGEKIMAFGDMSKFVIRDVMDMQLSVLRELYAINHQVGYVAIMRTDSDLLDAGTDPIKALALL
jgi:HK97 family phage major capsid protein